MIRILFVVLILFIIFIGCGGKETLRKSDESLLTKEALDAMKIIQKAYQEKDKYVLDGRISTAISGDILKNITFEKADLTFTPSLVKISEPYTIVNIDWQGVWLIEGDEIKSRGIADLVFKGSPMKLVRVDGINPFITTVIKRDQMDAEILDKTVSKTQDMDKGQLSGAKQEHETTGLAMKEPSGSLHITDQDKVEEESKERIAEVKQGEETESERQPDATDGKGYLIQVGAWKNPDFAHSTLKRIKKDYPEAVIIVENNFNKVRVMGIVSKERGVEVLEDLKAKHDLDPILMRTKSERKARRMRQQSESGGYFIQVGSWKNVNFAREALEKLKRHYYPDAYIVMQGVFNKVRVPGIMNREQGITVIENIEERFGLKPIIVQKIQYK